MATVLIVARVALALTFAVAAVAKLADTPGSRAALEGFGVPRRLVSAAALLLPAVEAGCAALLLIAPTAQVGASLATVLLVLFGGAIAVALRRGAHPDCHCFGQLHSRPAGSETIARNGVLAAVGLVIAVDGPGPSLGSWASTSSGDLVALATTGLLAVGLAYACLTLWSDNRQMTGRSGASARLRPLDAGQPIPRFEAVDSAGMSLTSDELLEGPARHVLVFTSATCGPCVGLLPELARWRGLLEGRLAIHVLASGDEGTNRRLSEEHGVPILLDSGGAVMRAFGVGATPSAVAIDDAGRLLAPVAVGAPSIEGLVRVTLKRPSSAVELVIHRVQPRRA